MYIVKSGIDIKETRWEAGDHIDEKDIPKKSKKWLLDQGIIAKQTKEEFVEEEVKKDLTDEENKVRAMNSKGHFIADDPDTPENEAWEEE